MHKLVKTILEQDFCGFSQLLRTYSLTYFAFHLGTGLSRDFKIFEKRFQGGFGPLGPVSSYGPTLNTPFQ